jgi:flavodoxin
MKAAIIYSSSHHMNTKKVLDAIAAKLPVDLIPVAKAADTDLSGYSLLGFASGIYKAFYAPRLTEFMKEYHFGKDQKAFLITTSGVRSKKYGVAEKRILEEKGVKVVSTYSCKGFDTFGPFKYIGGISKSHPNKKELEGAVKFMEKLLDNMK